MTPALQREQSAHPGILGFPALVFPPHQYYGPDGGRLQALGQIFRQIGLDVVVSALERIVILIAIPAMTLQ